MKGRDWEAKAEVTDAEITQAYEASKDQLRIPEQVSVRYIELSLADMLAKQSVSAEELDAAYQKHWLLKVRPSNAKRTIFCWK